MNLRKIRSFIRLLFSLLLCWLYVPHVLFGIFNRLVRSDLKRIEYQIGLKLPLVIQLIPDNCIAVGNPAKVIKVIN